MSVRQYIGARYVPRFSEVNNGIWSNVYSYEPLTIVKHGNDYYISKKSVPVGIQITDTEYWIKTGNYNGAITDLQNRVTAIENDDIPEIEDNISRLKQLKNKNVIWIGDSYGDEGTEHPNIINSIVGFAKFFNLSTGSTGFTGKEGSADQSVNLEWRTILKNWVDQQESDLLASIDEVYISGGFNDVYSTGVSTIRNYIASFMGYAKGVLPNANFHLCFCGWAAGSGTVTTPTESATAADFRFRLANKVMIAYSQCEQYGMEYMGNALNALHNYDVCFREDKYHPNSTGQERLARQILNYILGGGSLVYSKYIDGNPDQPFTLESLYDVSPYRTLFKSVTYDNDTIICKSNTEQYEGIPYVFENAVPVRTAVAIGNWKSTYIAPVMNSSQRIAYSIPVYVQTNDDCYPAELLMYPGGTLQIYCYHAIAANTNVNILLRGIFTSKIWDC